MGGTNEDLELTTSRLPESRRPSTVRSVLTSESGPPRSPSQEPLSYSTFTQRQKLQITILVSLASVFSPISATIYVPALPTIANDLNVSVAAVNLSVTSYMIFQGLSPSLWGSLTDVVGRRPVYLLTMIVYIGACIGLAFTTNYAELIVFRCLQSTGSASTIAIGAGVIGDITQRKERGGYIGFYSAGALVGNALGPIIGGIFAQKTGWHGIFYFLTALAAAFLIVLFLILPETLRSIVGNGSIKAGKTYLANPVFQFLVPAGASREIVSDSRSPRKDIDILGPIKMMKEKDVFCGLLFTALFYTVWQATLVASSSLFERVYHLNEISIGLSFIANGVGAVSASLLTGKVLDLDYRAAQRREKERQLASSSSDLERITTAARTVEHIEHARLRRLPYMAALFTSTCLAFGWCIQARTTIALPILWTFFSGFTTTSIMSMFSTLIVDWYPTAGASATAAINLARCLLGAGGTAAVQPMIDRLGAGVTFSIGAGITCLAVPFGVLVWMKGERWRSRRESRTA